MPDSYIRTTETWNYKFSLYGENHAAIVFPAFAAVNETIATGAGATFTAPDQSLLVHSGLQNVPTGVEPPRFQMISRRGMKAHSWFPFPNNPVDLR